MDKILKLKAEHATVLAEMKTMASDADKFDQEKYDGLKAKAEKIKAQIGNLEEVARLEAEMPAVTTVAAPCETKIEVGEEGWKKDPKKGFKSHTDFLMKVMEAGSLNRAGASSDPRLKFLATAGSDEQSTFSDPYGAFFIPEGFLPGFLSISTADDPIGSRTRKVPMNTPVLNINARVDKSHSTSVSGGLRVSRRAEADTVTASRMQFEQVKLEATALMGINYQTEELIARSPVSFASLVAGGFRDEFTARLNNERINGTGVGQFEGIYTNPALITVTKETGQSASTVVIENILKMAARVWGYDNAIWMANHTLRPQLTTLAIVVGTGGVPMYQLSRGEGFPDMLLGRPIVYTEFLPTLGTAGDLACVNWGEYLEGTLTNMQSAESVHVRFLNHERTYKFWMENDGRGWWRTALTPKNGDTMSPFVRLGAR